MKWKQLVEEWKKHHSLDEKLRQNLVEIELDEKTLEDAFYTPLEFGTAGMRGILGAGINRMNIYTVRQASLGLAHFISESGEEAKKRGVVIAYDSRHQSPEFAMEVAKTLGQKGIRSYVFESLRPTPELSFAVRHLNAASGVMITASHNPAEYNGYKVYGEDGGQMPPEEADKLTRFVRNVEKPLDIEVAEEEALKERGLLQIIGEAVDQAYLEEMASVTQDKELIKRMAEEVTIVFSPLHGTGKMIGERALHNAGFKNVHLVEEQAEPNPDFPTVVSPNPEDPEAFAYAEKLGAKVDADVLIATDPDADRLGMAVKTSTGQYEVLTGNQIAALMLDYLLEAKTGKGILPENSVIVKSVVSGELATEIAKKHDVETVNVLTGFKFIAEKISQYEENGTKHFLFGFEESYGYLVEPFVRDKDAIQALVVVSELAAYHKEKGQTIFDALEDLYKEHGYFEEKTIAVTMPGIEGGQKIKALMQQLQMNPPTSFAGIPVSVTEDYQRGERVEVDGTITPLEFPPSSVLKFMLQDGSWIAVRPSGTEPKIKFYMGVSAPEKLVVSEKLAALSEQMKKMSE